MSYVNPGYMPYQVWNPWVFANYGQPQRRRGYVSPIVYQSQAPLPQHAYLGETPEEESLRLQRRMLWLGVASVAIGALSLYVIMRRTRLPNGWVKRNAAQWTKKQAREWVRRQDEEEELDPNELRQAFIALYGRKPDQQDYDDGLWDLVNVALRENRRAALPPLPSVWRLRRTWGV